MGVLTYESGNPDFLDVPHVEMIKILAAQATVAIRNAMLYREVPLISIIEPLVRKKRALLSSRRRRWMTLGIALECALFLAFCPLPMRLGGDAVVAPQHLVTIAAPVDGNVTAVFAREGQRVTAGQVLGAMNDWQWRADLASTEAKYQQAMLVMQNDLAHGAAQSGADREQAEFLRAEMQRARTRVDDAQLRSPIDGIVVTPALGNTAGKHLDAGDAFAQVLDLSTAMVLVSIPERDTALMSQGEKVAIKLDSYPRANLARNGIGGESGGEGGRRRAHIYRSGAAHKCGRQFTGGNDGAGQDFAGLETRRLCMLRRPALWIWQTLWNWIGW